MSKQSLVHNSDGSVTIQKPFVTFKGKKSSLTRIEYNGFTYTAAGEALVCKLFGFAGKTDIDMRKFVPGSDDTAAILHVSDYVGEGIPNKIHVSALADDFKKEIIASITCIK